MRRASATVIVLACWGLTLYGQSPSDRITPRMTYGEFFEALDLGRDELAAVREAVDGGDMAAAIRTLATTMRGRPTPRWFVESPDPATAPGRIDPELRAEAEKILRHRLTSVGIEHQFGPVIDWRYNPTYEPDSPYARDNEWTWQLNRHWIWQTLGRAYAATGDERYAREFASQLLGWIQSCPVPVNWADQRPFSTWRTIEAGLRMAYSWPDAFFYFRQSPSFSDQALVTMLASVLEHARYLRAFPTRGNWLTMEMDGLYCAATLFPEFRQARDWRRFASETLTEELARQVYPDGAQIELTPGYHDVALRNFLRPLYLAQLNGDSLPDEYVAKLEKMFDFLLWISTPDRSVPRFNDAWDVDVPGRLREGVRLYPHRADFLWLATEGAQGQEPDHLHHLFPYAGIAVMRSDWSREANYLAMDAGPFGFGHQHEDKLSFVLYLGGKVFVQDAGSYAYDASQWRRYVLSARGHNVIHVDGCEQRRRGRPRESYVVKHPVPVVWRAGEQFAYLEAAFGGPEEPFETGLKARHTRRLLYLRGETPEQDLWILLDSLEPFDEKRHRYTSVFHLDVPEVRLDGEQRTLVAVKEGVRMEMRWTSRPELQVRVVRGQEEPVVQGWMPLSHGRRGVRPIPTPHFEFEAAGRHHVAYAISRGGIADFDWQRTDGDWRNPRIFLRTNDGRQLSVHWELAPAPPWETGGWAKCTSLVVEWRDRQGVQERLNVLP